MQLLFVYNADTGLFNSVTDIAHKILSPKTYNCNLCKLTHGVFSARDSWVKFLKSIEVPIEFLHRDEFIQRYPQNHTQLPAIFIQKDKSITLWLDHHAINSLKNVEALKALILDKLKSDQATS